MADVRLFSERVGKHIDALYAVLVASDEMQFFPEMLEIFGEESVVQFLDIFAGQTIVVPPRDVLEAKIRDVTMWGSWLRGGEAAIPKLSQEYNLTEDMVRERIQGIVECLKRVGVRSCRPAKFAGKPSGTST